MRSLMLDSRSSRRLRPRPTISVCVVRSAGNTDHRLRGARRPALTRTDRTERLTRVHSARSSAATSRGRGRRNRSPRTLRPAAPCTSRASSWPFANRRAAPRPSSSVAAPARSATASSRSRRRPTPSPPSPSLTRPRSTVASSVRRQSSSGGPLMRAQTSSLPSPLLPSRVVRCAQDAHELIASSRTRAQGRG